LCTCALQENKNIAGFDNVSASESCAGRKGLPKCFNYVCNSLLKHWATDPVSLATQCFCVQPGKCLYTTIRELVENGLDAAESISQLPDISIVV
jgi:hypothetical protein